MKLNLFCIFFTLFTSCAAHISGTVFLDANNNGLLDTHERALTNVTVKITHDSQLLHRMKTDAKGHFSVGSKGSGYYCVEVDEPALSESLLSQLASGQIPPEVAGSVSLPSISQQPVVEPKVQKQTLGSETAPSPPLQPVCGNGVVESPEECDDKNKIANDGCSSECKKEEATQKPPPPPPPPPEKKAPGVVCKNITGVNLTVHIPVTIDFKADVSRMPPPLLQTRKPGEVFSIGIPIPLGCILKSLFLPDGLEVVPSEESQIRVDPIVGRLDFSHLRDASSVKLNLKVKQDIPLGNNKVKISPEALCPDGQTVVLNSYEIELKSQPAIELWQSSPASCQLGGLVDWKVFVRNNGGRAFDAVHLIIQKPLRTEFNSFDRRCDSLGDELHCRIGTLAANETLPPLEFKIQLPGAIPATTMFVFVSELSSSDFADRISAPQGKCTIEAAAAPAP